MKFIQRLQTDYQMLSGKRLHCSNEANEYRAGNLVIRLYNDGIAFRTEGAEAYNEMTAYRIPEGTRRWMMQWNDAYEGFFPLTTTWKSKPERGADRKALSPEGYNRRWGYPALLEVSGKKEPVYVLITEANIEHGQSASCLYNDGELFRVVPDKHDGSSLSTLNSPLDPTGRFPQKEPSTLSHTPWRVAIIGSLSDVVESTLVTDVSEPCKLEDTDWIRPGTVSWIYWAYNHGSNDYSIIKKYVDMAATLHLPYVLIDAEWDEMRDGKTIEDAVAYAIARGVKPMIWYNSSVGWIDGAPGPKFRLNKPEDREREFAWCEKMGVAGVKIDFFSGDSQMNMDYCIDLLECAARHHLLVNFHGATVPRGWQRTYPNLLSTEGVYGAEWYNNVPTFTSKAARHNATLPFTRNVIGPMDYTPCTFSDSQHPHITTHVHELALTVLYESGLQHLADRPESYLAQPQQVQDFFSSIPTAWDETRLIGGYPGEYAVMARRCGDTWYVAGINGTDEKKTIKIDYSFAGNATYRILSFMDSNQSTSPWQISSTHQAPTNITCQPRGGFVLVMKKELPWGQGNLTMSRLAKNAVRIRYSQGEAKHDLPDWLYVNHREVADADLTVDTDNRQRLIIKDKAGKVVFTAQQHLLSNGEATLTFESSKDECLFGLGQFQDGYSNVRGLSRRLTQVNTQIALPMLISSKGYGILWNNYGLTEFNPCQQSVRLTKREGAGLREEVDVTSTEGGKKEVRERHIFEAMLNITEAGDYRLLLDVGQKMARRHNLTIDGVTAIEMQNLWLPPTASKIVHLEAGNHKLTAELTKEDQPVLYFDKVENNTTFRSPVAEAVDYTVFVGSPDEIIATYRQLTGQCPLMPSWALGYIHCRERFHSSEEILQTANRFKQEQLPVSMLVQDWQYWGKYGWNSMRFDEDYYPDPKALTDSLHRLDIRLMLSVWSKIDKKSEVGRQMEQQGYYIPGTDWIDFFNPEAAAAYWKNFKERLLPTGVDAWWQDATEPENDDLAGRRVNSGRWSGEQVRNVYPLLVNKTVYEGLVEAGRESMILTRCGFPGIQRYGSALWSGDVGNDWETFRRQLTAGLGVQAAGVPWWTYDAGGFFRPGNQYTDTAYIERMLRWIETSVYLPLMRVHGYMSNTEPWNYGPETQQIIKACLEERESLRPYIEKCARRIAEEGYTLMRPLVFDFADDPEALKQKYEYMFGPDLLVSPVTEPGVTEWTTYLPVNKGGWTEKHTGHHYTGGQYVTTPVDKTYIPIFIKK